MIIMKKVLVTSLVLSFILVSPSLKAEKYGLLYQIANFYTVSDADTFDQIVEKYRKKLDGRFKICIHQTLQGLPQNSVNPVAAYGQVHVAKNIAYNQFDQQRLWLGMMSEVAGGMRYKYTKDYTFRKQGLALQHVLNRDSTLDGTMDQVKQINDKQTAEPAESYLICEF